MPASSFNEFCQIFIDFFDDESDPNRRWQRVARLLVEEVTRPAAMDLYLGDDAYEQLMTNMRPVLRQEGLRGVGFAFFGGINDSDTDLLLDQLALYVEDPEAYELPDLPGLEEEEQDEEDEDEDENPNH